MSLPVNTTHLELDTALTERLQRLATARQRSSDWLMREAIEQYLTREEKREQFWQDTVDAWDEYRQTGLHVTGQEMEQWFNEIEAGKHCPPPECHL